MEKEISLIEQAKAGDKKAFKELIGPYVQKLLNIGYYILKNREDAWDILQETFILLWKNIKKLNTSYPFYPYVKKIYTNQCFKFLKKYRNQNDLSIDYIYEEDGQLQIKDTLPDPYKVLENKEIKEKIREIMDKMPAHYSSTLWLRIGEGMSYKEIADLLNINIGTVKSRINMARKILMEKLLAYMGGEIN